MTSSLLPLLLQIGFRHRVSAPNIEAAREQIQTLAGEPIDATVFYDAIAEALARGLICEPVRMPEGSLQCHWRLELTSDGAAAARRLLRQE